MWPGLAKGETGCLTADGKRAGVPECRSGCSVGAGLIEMSDNAAQQASGLQR